MPRMRPRTTSARRRWAWGWAPIALGCVVFAAAVVACPGAASAGGEFSLRAPVGASIGGGGGTRFELGLRSDLLLRSGEGDLAFGLAGEVSTVGFDYRRQELGLAFQDTPDYGSGVRAGPMLDAGLASDARARYVYGRGSLQVRTSVVGNENFLYALSSAIYLEVRRSISGPAVFETSVGLELGGGVFSAIVRVIGAFGASG
jgi:hypothetical protein